MAVTAYVGNFVDCPDLGVLRIRRNYAVVVDAQGYIQSFAPCTESTVAPPEAPQETFRAPTGSFFLPPFCDLHLHAPQYLYAGTGLDLPLMQWLEAYAFGAEERIDSDPALARRVYKRLAERLAEYGTGTVLLFGTIKVDTNLRLANIMQQAGVRAFVGKLSMDRSPHATYVESSASAAIISTKDFIRGVRASVAHLPEHERLVEPVITPRFIPSCSKELLEGLGQLAQTEDVRVQSHAVESKEETEMVTAEHGADDIVVFEKTGLLRPHTVLAHCTHVGSIATPSQQSGPPPTALDLNTLSAHGATIAHCPLSNAYFSTRTLPLREAIRAGVHVGLGSDIAGGYRIDIMSAMRHAVVASKGREGARVEREAQHSGNDERLDITWEESLYLATRGGARALGLPEGSGTFAVGAPFDAQLINLYDDNRMAVGPLDLFDLNEDTAGIDNVMVEKWWCVGDTRNRAALWTQGRRRWPPEKELS